MVDVQCQSLLNDWCTSNCPHARAHGALVALQDGSDGNTMRAWRCYAASTLTPDRLQYSSGSTYCTRDVQLRKVIEQCAGGGGQQSVAIDPTGASRRLPPQQRPVRPTPQPQPVKQMQQQAPTQRQPAHKPPVEAVWAPRRMAGRGLTTSPPPTYVHEQEWMVLPPKLVVPQVEDCGPDFAESAEFWAISLYSAAYSEKAKRLVASCELFGICCKPAFMPEGVFGELQEGSNPWRHRLIATKPLFMLETLRLSPLPIVWLDVDLEFHQFPTLFTPAGWVSPRDALLWNWQANVTAFQGRRLKMASGVGYFNKSARAEALLIAWSQAPSPHPPPPRARHRLASPPHPHPPPSFRTVCAGNVISSQPRRS